MAVTQVERATPQHLQNRIHQRRHAERILRLATLLPRDEQLLIEQIYRHGTPITDVATLLHIRPRTLSRRLRNILTRLDSDLFRFVATHIDILPAPVRPTARSIALHGHSLRTTARNLGLSLHRVREHMTAVRALARF